jgi:hypothetical protein
MEPNKDDKYEKRNPQPEPVDDLRSSACYTPGPWEVDKYMGLPTIFDTRGNGTVALASVHDMAIESADANASLMAAAPELLEACEKYLDAMDRYGHPDKTDRLMRAAIKKARGV